MRHTQQHEHQILAFALGDHELPLRREDLLQQLNDCDTCSGFCYRVLADLPLLAAGSGAEVAPASRAAVRAAARMEELLGAAADLASEGPVPVAPNRAEPESGWWERLSGWLHTAPLRPALGMALVAGMTWVVVVAGLQGRWQRMEHAFLANQLEQVLDAVPTHYGFAPGAPPSPYWRGYAAALLGTLNPDAHDHEALRTLRDAVTAARPAGGDPGVEGCTALVTNVIEERACRQGGYAFQLQQGIHQARARGSAEEARESLRSEAALHFLQWARDEAPATAAPRQVADNVTALQARGQAGLAPDAAELKRWERLVEGLLRDD